MLWITTLGVTHMVTMVLASASDAAPDVPTFEANVPIRAITQGPMSHWFAYYDKLEFDPTDRYVLGMEVGFNDRKNEPGDVIKLGMIDIENGDKWVEFAETTAWCWQQGCMLQWLPGSNTQVIYNTRQGDHYAAVIQDVFSGEKRTLPHPIYAVSPTGTQAIFGNFGRVADTRPGYGYYGIPDVGAADLHPDNDGLYVMDLETGEAKLLFSLDQISQFQLTPDPESGKHWFNHLLWNTDGTRFIFLHRWHRNKADIDPRYTRMLTAAPDGSGLCVVADHEMVSHFIWLNPKQILAWSREPEDGNQFHLYTDQSDVVETVGKDILKQDGHCTYSPDKKWVLTDTYPNKERMQTLMMFRPADSKLVILGKFYLPKTQSGEIRCDLHARWSRGGKYVCIDSMHMNGQRQLYLLDVSEVLATP